MAELNNLIGKRFGRFVVLEKAESRKGKTFWKCECDCGNKKEIYSYALTSGKAKSCGCLRSETSSNKGKMRVEDLTGRKFGRLTVVKRYGNTNGKRKLPTWLCQCDCGEIAIRTGKALKASKNSGCDKCRFLYMDLTGQKFGNLTVISRYISGDGEVLWHCKCDCGNVVKISTGRLNYGNVKSCGCAKAKRTTERNTTHGLSGTRLYEIWCGMKKRCYNKNSNAYENYGGRGIIICQEWLDDFMNFYNWAMENGYSDSLSIDRIDTNGNYEPSNCRWADDKTQSLNKRETIYFELFGEKKPLKEWCEYAEIKYARAYQRYKNGNQPFDENELNKVKEKLENGGI